MEHKYLFKAYYHDGTTYEQRPNDQSFKDPEKRTAFYDVEHDQLKEFELTNGTTRCIVSLLDGKISLITDNSTIILNPSEKDLSNFRVIYFRRHEITTNVSFTHTKHKFLSYILGWQANTPDGGNIKKTIEICI